MSKKLSIVIILSLFFVCCGNTAKTKKNSPEEYLSHTDYNIIFDNSIIEDIPIEIIEIGNLNLPTGQIVVGDPIVGFDMQPLKKAVTPGEYPVKLYIAKSNEWGDRVALAKLEFKDIKATKWILATHEGQDLSELTEEGDYFGFPVDAGLAAFFDYKTSIEYDNFLNEFITTHPESNFYDEIFDAEFRKNAKEPSNPDSYGEWINYTLPDSDLNLIIFQSGFGDGAYPAYWGISEEGEIVSLIIDFFVLSESEE